MEAEARRHGVLDTLVGCHGLGHELGQTYDVRKRLSVSYPLLWSLIHAPIIHARLINEINSLTWLVWM